VNATFDEPKPLWKKLQVHMPSLKMKNGM
jgi:hypothetical protein